MVDRHGTAHQYGIFVSPCANFPGEYTRANHKDLERHRQQPKNVSNRCKEGMDNKLLRGNQKKSLLPKEVRSRNRTSDPHCLFFRNPGTEEAGYSSGSNAER